MLPPYPDDAKAQLEAMGFHVDGVNALEIANDLGNPKVENIIVMGVLFKYMPFPLSVWEGVVKESVPAKTIEINLAAFEKGRTLIKGKE